MPRAAGDVEHAVIGLAGSSRDLLAAAPILADLMRSQIKSGEFALSLTITLAVRDHCALVGVACTRLPAWNSPRHAAQIFSTAQVGD